MVLMKLIFLCKKYITDIFDRATISDEKIVNTPLQPTVQLRPTDGEPLSTFHSLQTLGWSTNIFVYF